MASFRQLKGSGRWNVQLRQSGKTPVSATFDTRDQAERWVLDQESGIDRNVRLTFIELGLLYCERMLADKPTYEETIQRLHRIAKLLPKGASEITRQDMNEFRLLRLNQVSGVTVRNSIQLVNRVYRFAYREMIIDPEELPNPCQNIPMPPTSKPRNHVVSKAELASLLSELTPVMASIVELAFETAMRRSEILNLSKKDLNLEDRTLDIINAKTGDRICPLTSRAIEILGVVANRALNEESKLFQVTKWGVSQAVRRARRRAGLSEDVRLHQMRHSRITAVAARGLNPQQVMLVSGHRDIRSMARYSHLSVHDVLDKIDF
jgi:integrase|tara:strand:- start:231 stop:1193 length:963 start_codon:yes stop_codon:yes gene_type:complete